MKFNNHDGKTASDEARELLETVEEQYGFVPNLYGILAESPAALGGLMDLADRVSTTTLTPTEQQVVYLAISYENDCSYCVTGHTGVAKMLDVPDATVEAIRSGDAIGDPKLQALSEFSKTVLRHKGWVDDDELAAFLDAGFSKANALDVVLIISQKVLSNYAGHLTGVEIDEAFTPFTWVAPERADVPR